MKKTVFAGAGKSTLMVSLFGRPQASAGRVVFDIEDFTHLRTDDNARRGVLQHGEITLAGTRTELLASLQVRAAYLERACVNRRSPNDGRRPEAGILTRPVIRPGFRCATSAQRFHALPPSAEMSFHARLQRRRSPD